MALSSSSCGLLYSRRRYPLMEAKQLVNSVFRDKRLMAGGAEFWEAARPFVEETMAWHLAGEARRAELMRDLGDKHLTEQVRVRASS
jgi:hypothetical protein